MDEQMPPSAVPPSPAACFNLPTFHAASPSNCFVRCQRGGAARGLGHCACACITPANCHFTVQVFNAVVRHVDWEIVRCLVIAGPGFAKDEFREYLDKGGIRLGVVFD